MTQHGLSEFASIFDEQTEEPALCAAESFARHSSAGAACCHQLSKNFQARQLTRAARCRLTSTFVSAPKRSKQLPPDFDRAAAI